jgi:hypothetical protein
MRMNVRFAFRNAISGAVFRIRIRIHWSEVWIWIRIWILLSSCKTSKKNLDSYYFVTKNSMIRIHPPFRIRIHTKMSWIRNTAQEPNSVLDADQGSTLVM